MINTAKSTQSSDPPPKPLPPSPCRSIGAARLPERRNPLRVQAAGPAAAALPVLRSLLHGQHLARRTHGPRAGAVPHTPTIAERLRH